MSFVLLAVPFVSFGVGYYYGSCGSNSIPNAPPLSTELKTDIQKGILLKHVEIEEKKVEWSPHDYLIRQINNNKNILKKVPEKIEHIETNMLSELREKLKKRRISIQNI